METFLKQLSRPITAPLRTLSRRRILALVLSIVSFVLLVISGPWYLCFAGVVLTALFWTVSGLSLTAADEKTVWKLNLIWGSSTLALMAVIIPLMVKAITIYIPFEGKFILNMLCIALVGCVFLLITGHFRRAVNAASVFFLILATVNGYVFLFRDREFTFLDVYAASTALEVTGQYSFLPSGYMVCGWGLWAAALMAQSGIPKVKANPPVALRFLALGGIALSLLALLAGSRNFVPERWRTNGSIKNGYCLNFYLGIRDAFVREPENYSPETIGQMEQEYSSVPSLPDSTLAPTHPEPEREKPNILVIMNESYSDLRVFSQTLGKDIAVTPYWDSLEENTIKGYALSSVYGGNTVNSEFEFLTGSSMAWLPTGSVPYSQYISQNSYSLAWVLRSYGYTALAAHGYHAMGWNRDQVYPLLGFEATTFLDSFPQEDFIRSYISDREQYDVMLSMLAQQESPAFLFGVTMQNHGGYGADPQTYDHSVTLTGELEGFSDAEQYLSLVRQSDRALEYLLTQLEGMEEDTVVLIFGDHQPKLDPEFFEALNGAPLETLADQMKQHTVPFLIWANYELPQKELGLTSLNFLAGHLLDAAGLPRTAYHNYLGHLESIIPAMNALGYYSQTAQSFLPYEKAPQEEAPALLDYEVVQYNALFDREHSSDLFFDQYLPPEEIPDLPELTTPIPTTLPEFLPDFRFEQIH